MKRIAAIVVVVLGVAIVVGAFILTGGDGTTDAKSSTPTTPVNVPKQASQAITNAGTKIQSEAPTLPESDDEDDDDGDAETYETRKVFVAVSPNSVRIGREFKIEVRGFTPNTNVVVTVSGPAGITDYTIKVDKNGKGKSKDIKAPSVKGDYSVVAKGPGAPGQPQKAANTTLTVVNKK